MGGVGEDRGGGSGVGVGPLEQAHGDLGPKHAAHRLIDVGLIHAPSAHRARQVEEGGILHHHLHVQARVQRPRGGVGEVGGEVLGGERPDGVGVGDDESLEAHLAPQHVGEEPGVAGGGHAVQVHVGAHDVA